MAHGHVNAAGYTIGKVYREAEFVVERLNREAATNFSLMQLTIGSVLSKKAGTEFKKQMKKLGGDS